MNKILQGEIYWADLNPIKGHEQGGFRPVFILQNNILNRHLNTVVIAPITTNLQAKRYFTTYFLEQKQSNLPQDSVILLFQLRTIDKKRLKKRISKVSPQIFQNIKRQMYLIF